jgi:hypothetical protein
MTQRLLRFANAPSTPSSRRSPAPLHRDGGTPFSLSGPGPPPGRNGGERLALSICPHIQQHIRPHMTYSNSVIPTTITIPTTAIPTTSPPRRVQRARRACVGHRDHRCSHEAGHGDTCCRGIGSVGVGAMQRGMIFVRCPEKHGRNVHIFPPDQA